MDKIYSFVSTLSLSFSHFLNLLCVWVLCAKIRRRGRTRYGTIPTHAGHPGKPWWWSCLTMYSTVFTLHCGSLLWISARSQKRQTWNFNLCMGNLICTPSLALFFCIIILCAHGIIVEFQPFELFKWLIWTFLDLLCLFYKDGLYLRVYSSWPMLDLSRHLTKVYTTCRSLENPAYLQGQLAADLQIYSENLPDSFFIWL